MNTETPVSRLIQEAYDSLKASDADTALKTLDEALKIDFEDPEVRYALNCLNWWLEQFRRLDDTDDPYEKGGFILSQWNAFHVFLERIGKDYDRCLYAIRYFVFSLALQSFQNVLEDGRNQYEMNTGLLLQVGRCYKGVGNYEVALDYLVKADRFKGMNGQILSELADVYALLEETRSAKLYFREAFFWDSQGIDLRSMESELIKRLRDRVRSEFGYEGAELAEWIPIYGSLYGVFSVKRGLGALELGQLKQSIFSLEVELRNRPDNEALLRPRLINRYFWLIDHYENVQGEPGLPGLIEETMLKIKVIDPDIYERYRN
jgi:tetratricopeptide (TPR) repeat protein